MAPLRSLRLRSLMTVMCLVAFGGCASLGPSTEGTSGPLAWRVIDLAVVTQDVGGRPQEGRAFTLIIKNVGDRTVTLTKMNEKRYMPRVTGVSASYPIQWVLRPGAEQKIPRFSSLSCNSPQGCTDTTAAQPMFQIDFSGVDDRNNPVQARLDIVLPPTAVGRAPIIR